MSRNLLNKVAVITGGAVGIGLETADRFLQKGAKLVVLLDVNINQGNDAVKVLTQKHGANRAVFMKCDVTTDLEDVYKKIVGTYKTVDILVNNAGVLDDGNIKKTIEINVTALIEWGLKFHEHMRKDRGGKGGTIMNLASIYGYRVDPYLPVYQASKFAVMGFTRSLGNSFNYDRTDVRVVAICPGFTKTKLTAEINVIKDAELKTDFLRFLKAQAWQEVESVGKAAVDIYERADSGSAWLIEGARPIVEV